MRDGSPADFSAGLLAVAGPEVLEELVLGEDVTDDEAAGPAAADAGTEPVAGDDEAAERAAAPAAKALVAASFGTGRVLGSEEPEELDEPLGRSPGPLGTERAAGD